MTPEEIRAIAERIVGLLGEREWLPPPIRPEPPGGPHPGQLPAWAGSAQSLSDVAPSPGRNLPDTRHRPAYHALVTAARGAAAGRAPSPTTGIGDRRVGRPAAPTVPVAVSNRHIHLSAEHVGVLFGAGHHLTSDRAIRQPGQFAATERLRVVGPTGAIDDVRVVGPARGDTQVELAMSDCRLTGLAPVIRGSGHTEGSGAVRLEGPAGAVDLPHGAIVPARHLHLSEQDAARFRLGDGDRVDIIVGHADRALTLHGVLVRSGPTHATELHLDVDEAGACDAGPDTTATIVSRPVRPTPDRPARLITERDVAVLAADGQTLSDASGFLITPAARDRAKALGIWRHDG